ncbi:MAG: MFS transporter [Ilumatobacter sp.]|uniref:MFS transporter n=1 Tax=Ilumatobacter sp. TaxID=1967498 RepID=UPI00391C7443
MTVDSGRSWIVAIAGAVASGVAFGTVYTFGAFFEAMAEDFGAGRGATALVFGITLMCFFGFGLITGPLTDRVGPTPLVITGGLVMACALWLTSNVTSVGVGYVTYGLGVGVGGSMVGTPVWATVGMGFERHRALAMGVVATGNGLGTLLLVPTSQYLIDRHGWRNAYAILAAFVLVALVLAGLAMTRPIQPHHVPARTVIGRVVHRPEFRLLFGTSVLFSISLFIAFGFVVDFATGAGVDPGGAALLVGLIGASSVVGRLGLTALASRVSAIRLLQWCLLAQPVAFGTWLAADDSYPLLVVFALLMGISYGGFVSLGPEVMALLFGTVGVGSIMGLLFLGFGLGGLIGPPFAGWLADETSSAATIALALVVAVIACVLGWMIPDRSPSRELLSEAGELVQPRAPGTIGEGQ